MKSGSLSNTASLQNAVACEADYVEHLNALFTVLDKGASGSVISSEDIEVFRGHINDLVSWSKPPSLPLSPPCFPPLPPHIPGSVIMEHCDGCHVAIGNASWVVNIQRFSKKRL
eukprot:RCo019052